MGLLTTTFFAMVPGFANSVLKRTTPINLEALVLMKVKNPDGRYWIQKYCNITEIVLTKAQSAVNQFRDPKTDKKQDNADGQPKK